ncbi:hypothetical protein M951_chr149 (nucleomorph) [Lotharella oceanica]|uniref:Uncharacterized protein n=3 Tax=Lotharella oceanica TaxID=641309 RepID=A0A060D6B2_9EUKA|nr:hypothetical protein M951_chr149 [Lotharella oceanica]
MRSLHLFYTKLKGKLIYNNLNKTTNIKYIFKNVNIENLYIFKFFYESSKIDNFYIINFFEYKKYIDILNLYNYFLLQKNTTCNFFNDLNDIQLIKFFTFIKKEELKKKSIISFRFFFSTFLIFFSSLYKDFFDNALIISLYNLYRAYHCTQPNEKINFTNSIDKQSNYLINNSNLNFYAKTDVIPLSEDLNTYLSLKKYDKEKNIRSNIFKNLLNIEFYKTINMSRNIVYDMGLTSVCRNRDLSKHFYFFMKKLYISVIRNNNRYLLNYKNNNNLNKRKNNFSYCDNTKKNTLKIYFDSKNYSFKNSDILYHSVLFKISKYIINYSLVDFTYHDKIKNKKINDFSLRFLKKIRFSYGGDIVLSTKIKKLSFDFKKRNKNTIDTNLQKQYVIEYIDKIFYHNKNIGFRYFFGLFFLIIGESNKKIDFERMMFSENKYEKNYKTIDYDNLLSLFIKNSKNKQELEHSIIVPKKTLYLFIKEPEINPSMFKIRTNWYCRNKIAKKSNILMKFNKTFIKKKIIKTFDLIFKKIIYCESKAISNLNNFKYHRIYKKNYEKKKLLINLEIINLQTTVSKFHHLSNIVEEIIYFPKQIYVKNFKKFFISFQKFNSFLSPEIIQRKETNGFKYEIFKKIIIQKNIKFNDKDFINRLLIVRNSDKYYYSSILGEQKYNAQQFYKFYMVDNFLINFENRKDQQKNNYILFRFNKLKKSGMNLSDVFFCSQNSYFYDIENRFYNNNKFKLNVNNFEKFMIIFFTSINGHKKHNYSSYQKVYKNIFSNIKFENFYSEIEADLNEGDLNTVNLIDMDSIKTEKKFINKYILYMITNEKFAIYCFKNKTQSIMINNFGLDFFSEILNYTKMTYFNNINNSIYSNFFFNSEKVINLNDIFQSNQHIMNYESIYMYLLLCFGSRFVIKFYPSKRKNIIFRINNLKTFNNIMILQKNFVSNLNMVRNYDDYGSLNLSIFLIEKPLRNSKIVYFYKYYYKNSRISSYSFNNYYGWETFVNLHYSFKTGRINDDIRFENYEENEISDALIHNYLNFNMQKMLTHSYFYGRGLFYGKIKLGTFDICISKIKSLEDQDIFNLSVQNLK